MEKITSFLVILMLLTLLVNSIILMFDMISQKIERRKFYKKINKDVEKLTENTRKIKII